MSLCHAYRSDSTVAQRLKKAVRFFEQCDRGETHHYAFDYSDECRCVLTCDTLLPMLSIPLR